MNGNLILCVRLLHLFNHHDAELGKLDSSASVGVHLVDHVLHLYHRFCHGDRADEVFIMGFIMGAPICANYTLPLQEEKKYVLKVPCEYLMK